MVRRRRRGKTVRRGWEETLPCRRGASWATNRSLVDRLTAVVDLRSAAGGGETEGGETEGGETGVLLDVVGTFARWFSLLRPVIT